MRRGLAVGATATLLVAFIAMLAVYAPATLSQQAQGGNPNPQSSFDQLVTTNAARMMEEGRRIFRSDTFGSEAFWGDKLKLHQALAGVSPKAALALGLKLDAAAIPADVAQAIKAG